MATQRIKLQFQNGVARLFDCLVFFELGDQKLKGGGRGDTTIGFKLRMFLGTCGDPDGKFSLTNSEFWI